MTIKLTKELSAKVAAASAAAGYSSPEEFVEHVLEREVARLSAGDADPEILERLKGLGYID